MPIGSPDFVRQQLEDKSAEQDLLFHRIPLWRIPKHVGFRCSCVLQPGRTSGCAVHPDQSESFAVRHDSNVWRCMRAVLGVDGVSGTAQEVSQLPFSLGGLSLTSAVRLRVAAFWSSWADCFHIKQRHPEVIVASLKTLPHVSRQ